MTTVESFIERLKKIGIVVTLIGNYPWVYMDTVNGKKVMTKWLGNHGFTVFFSGTRPDQPAYKMNDTGVIFRKIRELVC